MPKEMLYAIGALIEPLSVAYNAVMRARPYLGQPVGIAGAGPIGLAMALYAQAAGASPIVITNLKQNRLQQARDMGFAKTLKIELDWDRLTTAKNIRKVMGLGCLPQIVFECTGAAGSICLLCTGEWGNIGPSWLREAQNQNPTHEYGVQRVRSISSPHSDTPNCAVVIRLTNEGIFGNVTQLITHTLPFKQAVEAMEITEDRSKLAVKIQIVEQVWVDEVPIDATFSDDKVMGYGLRFTTYAATSNSSTRTY